MWGWVSFNFKTIMWYNRARPRSSISQSTERTECSNLISGTQNRHGAPIHEIFKESKERRPARLSSPPRLPRQITQDLAQFRKTLYDSHKSDNDLTITHTTQNITKTDRLKHRTERWRVLLPSLALLIKVCWTLIPPVLRNQRRG